MALMNRQWKLAKTVTGMIGPEHFEKVEVPVPPVGEGEVLLKTLYLSFDPAQRTWLTKGSYMGQVVPGDVMKAMSVLQVVESRDPNFKAGELATATGGWQDYVLARASDKAMDLRKLPAFPPGVSPTLALSLFGITGLTAYFGLLEVGLMKEGDIVLVSGAAGATGSIVGQIAKIKGASKVIGIAGGREKCDYLKTIGFDEVVDYRDTSKRLVDQLRKACPKGIDVYFDNVGGEALESALLLLRQQARVVLCGGISQYNPQGASDVVGPKTYLSLIGARARMEGFLVFQFARRYPEGLKQLAEWHSKGLLKQNEDIRSGFDNIPITLQGLYTSSNFGKMLLKLHDPAPTSKL